MGRCFQFWVLPLLALSLIWGGAANLSAVPGVMNYQGVLSKSGTGAPLPAGNHTVLFRLWNSAAGTQPADLLWSETRTVPVDAFGRFNLNLGELTPLTPAAFASGEAWLELTVDGTVLTPRRKLASVPYALKAGDADTLSGQSGGDFLLRSDQRPIITVTEFGAQGDGVTDSKAAITQALASLGTGGGTLRFPPGRYLVGSTVIVSQPHVTLAGDNRDACVMLTANSSVTPLKVQASDVHIVSLSFQGVTGASTATGIEVTSGTSGAIDDCLATGFGFGAQIHSASLSPPSVAGWNLSRCDFGRNSQAGLYLHYCDDVRLSESVMDMAPQAGVLGLLIESATSDVCASRVNITGGSPLLVRSSLNATSVPLRLSFNEFLADSSYGFGMQFEAARDVTLVDSWAAGCKTGPGIVIGNQVSEMALLACRIFGNYQEGVRVVSGNANAFLKIENCHVGSNSTQGTGLWDGINVEPSVSNFVFNGNGCWNGAAGSGNRQRYGIAIGSGCDQFIVTNNHCRPNSTGGINNLAGTGSTRIVSANLQ
jgi:hypothetical protein